MSLFLERVSHQRLFGFGRVLCDTLPLSRQLNVTVQELLSESQRLCGRPPWVKLLYLRALQPPPTPADDTTSRTWDSMQTSLRTRVPNPVGFTPKSPEYLVPRSSPGRHVTPVRYHLKLCFGGLMCWIFCTD